MNSIKIIESILFDQVVCNTSAETVSAPDASNVSSKANRQKKAERVTKMCPWDYGITEILNGT